MTEMRRFFGRRSTPQEQEARTQNVTFDVVTDKRRFAHLIREMRVQSMLTTRTLANRLGIRQASLNQYFYRKRGAGGTSTLKWFLRFAEACGCQLYITFPSAKEAHRLESAPMKTPTFIGVGSLEEQVPDAEAHAGRS